MRAALDARPSPENVVIHRIVLLVASLMLLVAPHAAAGELEVRGDEPGDRIGLHLDLAHDGGGSLPLEPASVAQLSWAPSTKASPTFGFRSGTEWARVRLVPAHPGLVQLVLVVDYAQLDRVEVRTAPAGSSSWSPVAVSGDHVPASQRPLLDRRPAFALDLDAPTDVFVRVTTGSSHQVPIDLYGARAYEASRRRDDLLQALYMGALLVMLGYNLLYGMLSRAAGVLDYCGMLAAYVVFHGSWTGLVAASFDMPLPALADRALVAGALGVFLDRKSVV